LFFKHGILAFRIAIVLYFVFFPSTSSYRPANYESRPGHGRFVATDHASIITFLLCVLCILLLISGIEPKVIWRMTGQDFDELGTDATNVINSKNDFFTKLSSKIASESRGSKQYWNIIKIVDEL
jgi:hypothetical protein